MQQSNYKSLPGSTYSAQFRINGEVRDTTVTRYFTKDGGLITTYAGPDGREYAFGYGREAKKPVSIYCKLTASASGVGRVSKNSLSASGSDTPQPSASGSAPWYKFRTFDFSAPSAGLAFPRWKPQPGTPGSGSAGVGAYWPYVIALLGLFVAGGVIISAFGGSGGVLPNWPWLLVISLAVSVVFMLAGNYFGTQQSYSHLQGPLTWIMIILAAIMVFICGVFARRIWFSLLQSLLMWFVMEFGDVLLELHRTGAAMVQSFISGNLDPLLYMTFSAAAIYGVFVGVINKFGSVNADLKSVFIN